MRLGVEEVGSYTEKEDQVDENVGPSSARGCRSRRRRGWGGFEVHGGSKSLWDWKESWRNHYHAVVKQSQRRDCQTVVAGVDPTDSQECSWYGGHRMLELGVERLGPHLHAYKADFDGGDRCATTLHRGIWYDY